MDFRITMPEQGMPVYGDKTLKAATKAIYEKAEKIAVSMFEIAALIAEVDEKKAYLKDGFHSVHDWTASAFGIKKTLSYNLLAIGREYVQPVLSTSSSKQIGMKSNLTDSVTDDFSISQIAQMLPAGHAAAVELCKAGTITTDMTCRDIKAAIAAYIDDDEDEDEKPKKKKGKKRKEEDEDEEKTPLQILYALGEIIAQYEEPMKQAYTEDTETTHGGIYAAFEALADAFYGAFPNG